MILKCAPLLTLLYSSCLSQYAERPRQPDLPTSSSFYHSGKQSFKNSTRILGQNENLCYTKLKMTVKSPKSVTLTLLYQDCAWKLNIFHDKGLKDIWNLWPQTLNYHYMKALTYRATGVYNLIHLCRLHISNVAPSWPGQHQTKEISNHG